MFKFFGHSQFLEVWATSKEVVLFHDHDFVLLRFAWALTTHPLTGLAAMLWLTEKTNAYPGWLVISDKQTGIIIPSSLIALFVMSVDQYLATHYQFSTEHP